jgi:hypothetical protein
LADQVIDFQCFRVLISGLDRNDLAAFIGVKFQARVDINAHHSVNLFLINLRG